MVVTKARHDRHGNITIEFNSQEEVLRAPDEHDSKRKYLPCVASCDTLVVVALNVVSVTCDPCAYHRDNCDLVECTHAACAKER